MTFYEFVLCLEAYNEKLSTEAELARNNLAWHASSIINSIPFRKKKVTPKQLLGKQSQELKQAYTSKEEFKKSMRQG